MTWSGWAAWFGSRAALVCIWAVATGAQVAGPPPSPDAGPLREPAASAPLVFAAEYDGIIHPIATEFLVEAVERADAANAELLIVTLRTPGGLVDSTRAIITRLLAARTPVAVFVAPSGERAASAGFLLTLAADVAAMAPGTHIGAAHPVTGTGQPEDETSAKKAASDVAAYARTLAERRGRNVEFARQAVLDSRSFTAVEALEAAPPLIDLIAADRADLLRQLEGRRITRFDGTTVTLRLSDARVEEVELSGRQRLLATIAHPQIAYLLFSLGLLGLTVELWNPGLVAPGIIGGVCLLLAFFSLSVLPVSVAGLALVLLGIGLMVLEIKSPSFGVLGIGGAISLALGSTMLVGRDVPGLAVSTPLIWSVSLALALLFVFLGRLAMRAQAQRPATGASSMVDLEGRALRALAPRQPGQIAVRGEIWNAVSDAAVEPGALVRVIAVDGLTLRVVPAGLETSLHAPDEAPARR